MLLASPFIADAGLRFQLLGQEVQNGRLAMLAFAGIQKRLGHEETWEYCEVHGNY